MAAPDASPSKQFVLICGVLGFVLASCVSQADRERGALQAVFTDIALRNRSPQTRVWLHNREEKAIREIGMTCNSVEPPDKSRSRHSSWTREMAIQAEPVEIWNERYPDPMMMEAFWVRFADGLKAEFQLKHCFQPGDHSTIVIEAGGARVEPKVE